MAACRAEWMDGWTCSTEHDVHNEQHHVNVLILIKNSAAASELDAHTHKAGQIFIALFCAQHLYSTLVRCASAPLLMRKQVTLNCLN